MKIIDINNQERECERIFLDPHWPGYVTVMFVSKNRPGYQHNEWMPLTDFFAKNPSLKDKIAHDYAPPPLPPQIAGEVTGSGPDSLTDSTKDWRKNLYVGFYVWISRGQGQGQVRTILSNTAKKIKVAKFWEVQPDKSSQYTILHNMPKSAKTVGNFLPT